jgi:hypothetical protein
MAIWDIHQQAYRHNNNTLFEVNAIADKNGNIINSFGGAANIEIAAGLINGYKNIHKFGQVDGTADNISTCWTAASNVTTVLYPWDIVPGTVSAVSTSSADTQTIRIQGLDSDYNEVEEDLTLTGTVATGTTTQVFHRVHRAFCVTGPTNVGRININDSGETRAEIAPNMGQTLMALYTIPVGKTGYLCSFAASSSKNQSSTVALMARPEGGAFRTQSTLSLYQNNGKIDYPVPVKFEEKTDIEVRIFNGSNNTVSADFDLVLIDNETP